MKKNDAKNKDTTEYPERRKVLAIYMQVTGSTADIFDVNFRLPGKESRGSIEQNICRHCSGNGVRSGTSCRAMHMDAMGESGRQGSSLIYQCELGLMFWVSPTYNRNTYHGCLRGSGYVNSNADESTFAEKCNGTISSQEFARRISELPRGDAGKIRSLAEMLLLCAEFLSNGSKNYHELLRLRSYQMNKLSAQLEELKVKYGKESALPDYPLDKEHQLVDSLRRGDKKETEKILNELLATLVYCKGNNFRHIQLRALELAVLLVRSEIPPGRTTMENNARFIRQIREAKTIEELSGLLHSMSEGIATSVKLFQDIPHASAMRKAEQFIRENLFRKISLREISKIAGLSPPYFSTIFKDEMGENLSRYINRLRVEKASKLLMETDLPLGEIAGECCFEDQSWFTKIFKSFTGISPGKYRNQSIVW